jgi:hypothetical protein
MFSEILEKLGIKSPDELTPEERAVYQQWAKTFAAAEVTIDTLKQFLPGELARARAEAMKYENSEKRDLFFKAYCRLLDTLTQIIVTPAAQRDQLRERLKQQFHIDV